MRNQYYSRVVWRKENGKQDEKLIPLRTDKKSEAVVRNTAVTKVEDTIKAFGGKFLVRGGEIAYSEGKKLGDLNVIVEFPDRESALNWKKSSEYQAILPGRIENATTQFIIIDGVA